MHPTPGDTDERPNPKVRPPLVHPDPRSLSVALELPRILARADASTRRPRRSPSPGELGDDRARRSSRLLLHPRRADTPEGAPPHLVGAERTVLETSQPPDQVRFTHERQTQVSQPRRRIPASSKAGPHRLSTVSFLPRPWGSRVDRDPPARPDPRSVEVREQLRVSRRRSLAVLGFLASSRPRDREAPPALAYRPAPKDVSLHRRESPRLR